MEQLGTDPLVGALIDQRYQVKSRLARGGMSTVYLAEDIRLERDVALKVLYPHLAEDRSFLARFRLEATSAAKLSHPHVVSVLDQGMNGQLAYLVMEFVRGHTLRDVLEEKGRLAPRLALALLEPVVEGLGAAHAAGLIHRDVKPENILMSDDGRIKIGDFGLARAVSAHTSTGALIGTVAYLSPELVTGAAADARSDIYAVGILLYEMLTGRQPFTGESAIQVAFQHVHETVPAPSLLVPGLAADLDELVLWCTASDPEERPVDGNALLGELHHVRMTLTDAQLDLSVPPAPAMPDYQPSARPSGTVSSAVPDGSGDDAGRAGAEGPTGGAGIPSRGEQPTTVIGLDHRRTQALPRAARAADAVPAAGLHPGSGIPSGTGRAGARQAKRQLREQQRRWNKQAQQPQAFLRPGNSARRGWIWAAVIVLLTAAVALAAWFFGLGPGAPVTVPDVSGRPAAEAEAALRDLGLETSQRPVFDEVVAKDLVVGTEPAALAEIRRFQPVQLIVSRGPELFSVPNVLGKNADAAREDLTEAGLRAGRVSEDYSESVAAGLVLSQAPSADEQLRRNAAVDFVVSRGPRPINVPSVAGRTEAEARRILSAAGLNAEVVAERVFDAAVPAGSVVRQDPAQGQLQRGGTVTLTLSQGPRMVEVPDLTGVQLDEARRRLEELGFEVRVNRIFGGIFGTVRSREPAGASLPEGSVITLNVV